MADSHDPSDRPDRRRVIVGVTGGIAAYKTAYLVSLLTQGGDEVTVMMTDAAARFVGPLTFQSLSGRRVFTSLWEADDRPDAQHIALARSAALMIIAPCSANTLGKLAAGVCDNLVTTVAMALPRDPQPTPLLLAPAMNADMWAHPIVQRNARTLGELDGVHLVGPETGWQACRTAGPGRMAEPRTIHDRARDLLG
jgi:phosphopantothenoylcysteine decarboxylase/phosphopantothenate--cysteine ligase